MKNKKIIQSYNKIDPDEATQERIFNQIMDRVESGQADVKKENIQNRKVQDEAIVMKEYSLQKSSRNRHRGVSKFTMAAASVLAASFLLVWAYAAVVFISRNPINTPDISNAPQLIGIKVPVDENFVKEIKNIFPGNLEKGYYISAQLFSVQENDSGGFPLRQSSYILEKDKQNSIYLSESFEKSYSAVTYEFSEDLQKILVFYVDNSDTTDPQNPLKYVAIFDRNGNQVYGKTDRFPGSNCLTENSGCAEFFRMYDNLRYAYYYNYSATPLRDFVIDTETGKRYNLPEDSFISGFKDGVFLMYDRGDYTDSSGYYLYDLVKNERTDLNMGHPEYDSVELISSDKIIYRKDGNFFLMNVDGSGYEVFQEGKFGSKFSPDGKYMAYNIIPDFDSNEPEDPGIYIMNLETKEVVHHIPPKGQVFDSFKWVTVN